MSMSTRTISLSTSDESEDEIKVEQPQGEMLGEISLITSDEDSCSDVPKRKTRKTKVEKVPKKRKKSLTIDLLTSDEDENMAVEPQKTATTKPTRKRKQPVPSTSKLPAKKPKKTPKDVNINTAWSKFQLLSIKSEVPEDIAKTIVRMFDEGNTIPFIARYRREQTGNMTPDQLRDIRESYEDICTLKSRISTVITAVKKAGKLTPALNQSILATTSAEELEHIYAPFKPEAKRSLAERAKELGLEEPAKRFLDNVGIVDIEEFVNPAEKELKTPRKVKEGIVHIIASFIATNTELLTYLRDLRQQTNFSIEIKQSGTKSTKQGKKQSTEEAPSKFDIYFDKTLSVQSIKPHQILAINRGETQKCLSVKIIVPEFFENKYVKFCRKKWIGISSKYNRDRCNVLDEAIKDAYTRLIQPLISREIRADLKNKAEKASIEVFCKNLKQLLLGAPLKGKPILGIDPGFKNGCKIAVISPTGDVMGTNVIFPHYGKENHMNKRILKEMLDTYNCDMIALGNRTACRETEKWLSDLIKAKFFTPRNVRYTIVNEDGASIYSCSSEAKKEFPDMDPNLISAVSLARRVQEPMAEFIKIEPAHLGIGMYQLDLKKKQLTEALEDVVSECVSFVGVDVNTASQCLLRKVAGLSDKRATQIIDHRQRTGTFSNRKELLKVFGIGPRIYEQCAGFLRVAPATVEDSVSFYKQKNTTKLDATIIHPESYEITRKIIKKFNLNEKDIGTDTFIQVVKCHMDRLSVENLATELKSSTDTIKLITDALTKKLNYDFRYEVGDAPLFKAELMDFDSLRTGNILTGQVINVTHFGAFVDIGVGINALVHTSKYNGLSLNIGNKVEVKILELLPLKRQIRIEALRIMT